jgi:hypothetical protein
MSVAENLPGIHHSKSAAQEIYFQQKLCRAIDALTAARYRK